MKYFKIMWMVIVLSVTTTLMMGSTSTYAANELPHTFSPGQTISSAQVNANFQALSAQIAVPQAQLAPVSIVGTYDYFSLGFGMKANVIKHKHEEGTLVFTADTVTVIGTGVTDKMIVINDGTAGVISTEKGPEVGTVAYTVTGSTVTFSASPIDDSGFVGTLSADKKILIGLWKNTAKGNKGTIVAIKRMYREDVTISNFVGTWKGNGTFVSYDETNNESVTLSLSIGGSSLSGSLITGTDTPVDIHGSVENGKFIFALPKPEPINPDCAKWGVLSTATLDESLTRISLISEGTFCSGSGGKPGIFSASLIKQ